jgi:hypothetical protein
MASHQEGSLNDIFFDYMLPDAQALSADGNVTDFGRIKFHFFSNGSVVNNAHQSVTADEVLLRIRLIFGDAMTVYAVRRLKVGSYDTDVSARLTPMQASSLRSRPVADGFFAAKPRPVDFSCTEFDLSELPSGTSITRCRRRSTSLLTLACRNACSVDCNLFRQL